MRKKIIFTTTDPESRTIRLDTEAWQHIKKRHPEIKTTSEVKQTIRKPDIIIQNERRQTITYSKTENMNLYSNVYARMNSTYNEGSVATAYKTRTLPEGDVIWYKKD